MAASGPRVMFLSQMGAPGSYDPAIFAEAPGGDDEGHWICLRFQEMGLLDAMQYSTRRVCHGALPPEPDEADLVILGGSYHSVHDDLPYQRRLLDWFGRWRKAGRPLFGICGGHQLMAHWQGVEIDTVPDGPMCATHTIALTGEGQTHPLFAGLEAQDLSFHFGNYERLSRLPDGATLLAHRPEMPAMAVDHGGSWWSVQFHPEADRDVFVMSWSQFNTEYGRNYRPVPNSTALLRNFLINHGVKA